MMKDLFKVFLLWQLLLSSSSLFAQTADSAIKTYFLPWHTIQLPPEIRAKASESMDKAYEQSIQSNDGNIKSLLKIIDTNKNLTQNLKLRIKKFMTSPQGGETQFIYPTICSLANQYLIFLTHTQYGTGKIIASTHRTIPKEEFHQSLQEKRLDALLLGVLNNLSIANENQTATPQSALKVSFALSRETTGTKHGSSLCLNMLLEENLARQYSVMSTTNTEDMESVYRVMGFPTVSRRSTRKIINSWFFNNQDNLNFPLTLKLRSQYAEAVMGQNIQTSMKSIYTLSIQNNQIQIIPDKNIESFLNQEDKALNLADSPTVSKIYRAWVYLDKGRAWGLKMSDRLVIRGKESEIQGHVVGYFGKEMNLKSPKGYDINEGAIVFIRKGQRKTRVGQEFIFDPKQYP